MTTGARPKAVIFDWDNTLVDSWPVIHEALAHTFRTYGLTPWTLDEVKDRVRHSLRNSFPKLFGDEWQAAGDVFYTHYGDIHAEMIAPLDGVPEMLEGLRDAGLYMAVVSNKRGDFLRVEAERLGWNAHFGRLVGATDAPRDKPDPGPVDMALAAGGLSRADGAETWFVGDADIDMECAHVCRLTPVLLRPTAPDGDEFGAHPPVHHFKTAAALCNFIVPR